MLYRQSDSHQNPPSPQNNLIFIDFSSLFYWSSVYNKRFSFRLSKKRNIFFDFLFFMLLSVNLFFIRFFYCVHCFAHFFYNFFLFCSFHISIPDVSNSRNVKFFFVGSPSKLVGFWLFQNIKLPMITKTKSTTHIRFQRWQTFSKWKWNAVLFDTK